ncbi:MAG: ATP-binding domain-containing protein, partial [Bacteroidales bacterium]|nr:ATP-binding domain-containing protein [Bacteroidales bacterium]
IQNILSFTTDFPEAKIFRLERNYRSTRNIVNAANTVIAKNEGRIPKQCVSMGEEGEKIHLVSSYTEQEEAMQVVSSIITRMRTDHAEYEDFAVLYRTNSQSRALEEQLRRRNIPYMIYSGNSFFERAEVKDMMAYFKLAVNVNDDEAFKRVVNKPARGIGDTSLNALAAAATANGISLFKAAYLPGLDAFGLRDAAVSKIRAFCDLISKVDAAAGTAWDTAMTLASESGMYLFYKADTSIEGQSRFANVQELLDSVKAYEEEVQGNYVNALVEDGVVSDVSEVPAADLPKVTLGEYLENVSLLSNVDVAEDQTRNRVALMTVHSAKGLEFPYVYLTGMEENLFPSGGWLLTPKDLEEERRLFYVGLTRAKKVATVSFAATRMRNGKHESNAPSRFLREIAPQYLDKPLRREDISSSFDGDFSDERKSFSRQIHSGGFTPLRMTNKPTGSVQRSAIPGRSSSVILSEANESKRQTAPKPQFAPRPDIIDANFVPDPMSSFKVGDRIEHNRFGAGQVLEISGQIPELKAKIHFDQYGDKLLLLKFAKLRHI